MRYFKAAHTFNAEEAVELSVTKGEYLTVVDNVVQDGWIKVEAMEDASRRGFVPLSYLKEVSAADITTKHSSPSSASRQARSPGSKGNSPSPSSQPDRPKREKSPQQQQQQLQLVATEVRSPPQKLQDESSTGPTFTPAQIAAGPVSSSLLQNPNGIVDAFMKNEVYYKQLMRQRSDALVKMQLGLEDAMTEVAACKDKNAALSKKLRELDQVLERERQRWSERVEEEKSYVNRSLSSHHPIAPASAGNSLAASPVNSAQRGYNNSQI